jgi:poly [ADP-ribose] polymerase 10/14/15
VETITEHEHNLNGARLTISPHYQFMNTITETTYRTIKINSDVLDHAINKCEEEIRDQFGAETLEVIQGKEEEFLLPEEVAKEIKKFMEQFTVEEIPFCKKLLDASKDELKKMVTTANDGNVTIAIEEELPQMKIVGMKKCTKETYEHFKNKISEMEKELDVASEQVSLSEDKLELFLLHGADNMLKNKFHVRVKIEPTKGNITIEGPKEQVSLAVNEAYKKCSQIVEHNIDLSQAEKHFLESGGLGVLNNGMKSKGLKGMIFLDGKIGTSKAKVTVFEGTTTDDVQSYLSRNMSVKKFSLDEDSLTLLKSNKWKEFCENSKAENSVTIYTSAKSSSTEILLVGRVQDVEKTHETLNKFMTRNTIVKESVDLEEGCVAYLAQHRKKDLEEIKTKLQEHSVRMHLMEHEGKVNIDGTKEGVKEARKYVQDIISNIARGKMCFDKLRAQEYLESEQGKLSMEGIETKHSCSIRLIKDDGERSTIVPPRPKQPSKLLCSYETREKISLKVFNDDIVKHSCDVMVNAANSNLKHVGGVAKSILDAGGREIQDECDAHVNTEGSLFDGESFSGSPGKLPCKRLIHAVSPRWDVSKSEKICKTLRFTCRRVFEKAMDCQSIAIPAIGSGIFGIPKETCAEIMIEAAEEFAQKNPNSALKDIHFVNNDDVTCQVFLRKFREKFRGRPTFTDSLAMNYSRSRFGPSKSRFQRKDSKPKKEPESASEPLPQRKSGDFIITQRNMKISVVCGDLSTYKVLYHIHCHYYSR